MDKEYAKSKLLELLSKFSAYEKQGKLSGMSENDTKAIFIEPLFEALGWDAKNYDEISRERQILHGRADYAFCTGGVVRFFVEAKAAGVELAEKEAWQVINYAYMQSVPWAVLTNFRELIIYNASWKAKKSEESRFLRFNAYDLIANFDDLWLLSREAVISGELEKKAQKYGKLLREPVTKALYQDLMRWRSTLSKCIVKNDPRRKLTKLHVDEGVQRFLNRLIFIRTCEGRKIENEQLRAALRQWQQENSRRLRSYLHDIVTENFAQAYDSDIFFPHMAGELLVDDEVLSQIIGELYESPSGAQYDFDAINADVLGNIYEQYLATVMREGGGMLEKEGKRKEMGIYYTPTYIVDYIVKNTLGELIAKAKTPEDLQNITVLDPACGSGSFLIRAFETLREAYSRKNGGDHEMLGENVSKNAHDILTKNIHGVDLDIMAIEIADLNLLLRAATRRGLLPPLKDNIKQGNSLISGTKEELEEYFGSGWQSKHPFNWEQEFPNVFAKGGFDIVIGNPPYGAKFDDDDLKYFQKFKTSKIKNYDSYIFFIENCIKLLKEGGYFAFIVPDTFLRKSEMITLRELILSHFKVKSIAELGVVFDDAKTTENVIFIFEKCSVEKVRMNSTFIHCTLDKNETKESRLLQLAKNSWDSRGLVKQKTWASSPEVRLGRFNNPKLLGIIEKIEQGELIGNLQGIEISRGSEGGKDQIVDKKMKSIHKPILIPDDIWKYGLKFSNRFYEIEEDTKYKDEKIMVIRIRNTKLPDRIIASYDADGYCTLKTIQFLNFQKDSNPNPKYILGILNSKVTNFYCHHYLSDDINKKYIEGIRVKVVSSSDQQPIIRLVEKMLDLNRKLVEMGDIQTIERQKLEEELRRTDAQIDGLVYNLYGITEEEIKIIEESFQKK